MAIDKEALEELYSKYNRREFVHPDPLEFLYDYEDVRDREIVGLVAASLAYGRVAQILVSVSSVLERMKSPRAFLDNATEKTLQRAFMGFRHRFTDGEALAGMLAGAKRVIERHCSLQACFASGLHREDETILPALSSFVKELDGSHATRRGWLMASPPKGSACKRWNLFLRWMVRQDEVDPGGWNDVPTSKLVVPLDTHMHRISLSLGLTRRRQANCRTAVEVTNAFREIAPADPVRYDFALTRLGIHPEADLKAFLDRTGVAFAAGKRI